ncbi:protein of unknown function [endosymbiont DhMRE of Dentiscutata heterogama]|nr:protein of unknown function [endosymbiont DhMRE of Dentiscutata heterogama]
MLFLSLIKSGLVNEDHIDSQRKFIKYEFLKNKLEEIYPQKKSSQSDGSPPSEDGLAQTKKNAIQTITAALNLEPAVKESELSSEFQGWNEKINNLDKEEIINDLVKKMLSAIGSKRREKQTSQKVNENVNDMKNKTGEELNEKIKENDEASDTRAYEEKKEEIQTQKKRSALEDPNKYRRNVAIPGIKETMAKNDIREDELDDETKRDWEKLKNGEIQGEEIVEKEIKIKQSISRQGAEKKVNFFRNEVEIALKSGKKERIEKLKMQMIEFINADNVFYESKKSEVRSLLSKLDNYKQQKNNSLEKFPWKVVVPVSLLAVMLIIIALVVIRKRKRISQITKTKTKTTN